MAKVTQQIVLNSGISYPELLQLLIKNVAAEFTTYYYYKILRANLRGIEGETF